MVGHLLLLRTDAEREQRVGKDQIGDARMLASFVMVGQQIMCSGNNYGF